MALMKIKREDGKVAFVNLGGQGGAVAVDQIYNPASENAQSGTAVAQAIEQALGDVSSILDEIIALQDFYTGGTFDELHTYAQSVANGGAE